MTSTDAKIVVLVVEDEPFIRMDAVDALEDAGFFVLDAANADEAVAILEQRKDVDVVFTDVNMPGSIDGLGLCAAIRQKWPRIGVVIVSGMHRIAASSLPTRTQFFEKPYDYGRIISAIGQLGAARSPR